MTATVTRDDLEAFEALLRELEREAAGLSARLAEEGRGQWREGADMIQRIAADFAGRAAQGELRPSGQPSALPLSRPFGEWDPGDGSAEPVWQAIERVDGFWADRLGSGVFELR